MRKILPIVFTFYSIFSFAQVLNTSLLEVNKMWQEVELQPTLSIENSDPSQEKTQTHLLETARFLKAQNLKEPH